MREAANVLDPDALTLGFARRFTGYKRPNLLLENLDQSGLRFGPGLRMRSGSA